jgi:hypothetical protein
MSSFRGEGKGEIPMTPSFPVSGPFVMMTARPTSTKTLKDMAPDTRTGGGDGVLLFSCNARTVTKWIYVSEKISKSLMARFRGVGMKSQIDHIFRLGQEIHLCWMLESTTTTTTTTTTAETDRTPEHGKL